MKNLILALISLLLVCGCRRTDVRDFTISIPSMAPADRDRVTAALCVYDGVKRDSLKFDFEGHAVSLRYDSMRVAKKNLEMAVAALGLTANGVTPQSLGGAQAAPSKR